MIETKILFAEEESGTDDTETTTDESLSLMLESGLTPLGSIVTLVLESKLRLLEVEFVDDTELKASSSNPVSFKTFAQM